VRLKSGGGRQPADGRRHDAGPRAAQLKAEDEGAAAELKRLLRSTASIYRTLLSHAEAAHVEVPPAPRPGPKHLTAASERPPSSLLHGLCLACTCLGIAHGAGQTRRGMVNRGPCCSLTSLRWASWAAACLQ